MKGKKQTLEDVIRYRQMLNPVKLAIVLILYASEVLEKMDLHSSASSTNKEIGPIPPEEVD